MPLEICKLPRSSRSKIRREQQYSLPEKDYCANQSSHYYGYKLHVACSFQGVIESLDISSACVYDINYLKDVQH